MKPADITSFVLRDLDIFNARLAADMAAGMSTLAIAATISALTMMVFEAAHRMTEFAIERTRSVAAGIEFRSEIGRFEVRDYERLTTALKAMNEVVDREQAAVTSWTPIVSVIEPDELRLVNRSGTHARVARASLWSIPPDAAFLDTEHGVQYLCGGPFSRKADDERRPCGKTQGAQEPSASAEDSDGWHPRLGVIVNTSYVKKFRELDDKDMDATIKEGGLEFPEIFIEARIGPTQIATLGLEVTGVIHEAHYPDLLFTEDLARAFFLRERSIQDCDLLEFRQWESGTPLRIVKPEGARAPTDNTECQFPESKEQFDYWFSGGGTPYGRVIATVYDWKTPGTRRRIRDELRSLELIGEARRPQELLQVLRMAVEPELRRGTVDLEAAEEMALDAIEEELRPTHPGIALSDAADIEWPEMTDLKYRMVDASTGWIIEIVYPEGPEGRATVHIAPSWKGTVQGERLVESLLNVRGIMELYSNAMRALVLLLAGGTALLLAISHVLRKRRDIGVLLANGASPGELFAVYVGEILLMTLVGSAVGLAAAFAIAPWAEAPAYEVIARIAGTALGESRLDETEWQLVLTPITAAKAAALVVAPAFLASIAPVWSAARTEPLSSLDRGI